MIQSEELFCGQSLKYKTPLNTSETLEDNMNFYHNVVPKSGAAY